MDYLFVTWRDIERLVSRLAVAIEDAGFEPDIIVGVSRGGLVPTRLLSDYLDVRDVVILGVAFYEDVGKAGTEPRITHPLSRDIRGKRVVLVDDVSDTGGSLDLAKKHVAGFEPSQLLVCTLHRKPWSTFEPDIFIEETDRWIIYAWEKIEAGSHILDGGQEEELREAGFSEHDIDLLRSLEIAPSKPDPLEDEH